MIPVVTQIYLELFTVHLSSGGVEEEDHEREDKSGCGGICKVKSFFLANLKLVSR